MPPGRQYLLYLILVLAIGVFSVQVVTTWRLYDFTIDTVRDRLLDSVAGFGRYIEEEFSQGESEADILSMLDRAYVRHAYISPTFEFVLGRRDGNRIDFLLEHRFKGAETGSVPYNSHLAEPMRRALRGETDTAIAPDYRGETVVAAFTHIHGPEWGLVLKVDRREVLDRFLGTALLSGLAALFIIVAGSLAVHMLTQPMRERFMALNRQMHDILQAVGTGIIVADLRGIVRHFNPAAERMFGYGAYEVIGRNVSMLTPESVAVQHDGYLERYAKSGSSGIVGMLREVNGRHRCGTEIPIGLFVTEAMIGGERLLIGSLLDLSDRLQAERDLAERERQLTTLMGNLPGMAYRCRNDSDWAMLFVSDGSIPLTGYRPAELIGNNGISYGDIVEPEDRDLVFESVQAALAKDEPFQLTYRIRRRDGGTRWVWERGIGIPQPDGLPALEGFIMDITSAKESQDLLRTSEERFRLIVEGKATLFGTYIIAEDGAGTPRFSYVSPKFCEIFNKTPDKLINTVPMDLVHPKDRERVAANLRQRLVGDKANIHYDFQAFRGDGEEISVEVFGGNAELQGRTVVLGVLLDVTVRKKAERLDAYLRDLNELLPTPICVRRRNGTILFTNQAFADYWGGGQKPRLFDEGEQEFRLPPEIAAVIRQDDEKIFTDGCDDETRERHIRTADGEERIFHTYRRKVTFEAEDAVLEVMLDITERVRSDVERMEAKIAAEAAEEARLLTESFLASVTHETRTPVHQTTSFLALATKAVKRQQPDLALEHLEDAEAATARMLALIDDLLDLAKIRAGQMEFDMRPVDVSDIVQRAISHERTRASDKGISITLACDGGGGGGGDGGGEVMVRGDQRRLRQVFANLFSNAVKFTEIGGVTINIQERDGWCRVVVADTGPGIPKDDREKIFEPFYQSEEGRAKTGGTGLGLAICREIVTSHDGRIWTEPNQAGGSIFVVELPSEALAAEYAAAGRSGA